MTHARGFGSVRHIFPLPDLTLKPDIRQPEVLYTEDAVRALERRVELSAVLHIAGDDLRAECFQLLRSRFVHLTRQCANLPAICQKFSCNCAALLTGCTGDGNDFIVHRLPLLFGFPWWSRYGRDNLRPTRPPLCFYFFVSW